ncbi:MAG TPA: glycosyltransferase [Burkholderiales bacterium]|nr:glycosyltransferase [Burkholderiales bacterium]
MRILYVSDVYFPRVNGVSTSIRTFRRELQALGHEVTLVAPRYPQSTERDEPGIVRLAARAIPLDPEDRLMHASALRRIPAHLGARTFDLVHIQTPFAAHYAGLRIARELNVPCIGTYHTFFEEYLYHYVPFAPRALLRAAARAISRRQGNQVDALVVPSRAMLAALTAYGVRSAMTILPTGIPLSELTRGDGAAFRRRHGIPPDRPLLLHVGRVAFEKNIDFLLRMFSRVRAAHPDALLVICGEGPALRHLKQLARRLGVAAQVHFIGYLDRAGALLDCYSAADVFVFASRTETQGLVLLEAMALEVPVVAIAEMGTLDILENGRGALIAPNDEQTFAGAVCQLLDSSPRRRDLAAAGRCHATQWDAARLARQLVDFYTQVIERAAVRGAASSQAPAVIGGGGAQRHAFVKDP